MGNLSGTNLHCGKWGVRLKGAELKMWLSVAQLRNPPCSSCMPSNMKTLTVFGRSPPHLPPRGKPWPRYNLMFDIKFFSPTFLAFAFGPGGFREDEAGHCFH